MRLEIGSLMVEACPVLWLLLLRQPFRSMVALRAHECVKMWLVGVCVGLVLGA